MLNMSPQKPFWDPVVGISPKVSGQFGYEWVKFIIQFKQNNFPNNIDTW